MILNEHDAIAGLLKRGYFWDVDTGKSVPKRLIIERIFSLGTLDEIALIINHFGKEEVEKTLRNLNYIDRKTFNFVSKLFGIPKKEFKCYLRRQSIPLHWDF